MTILFITIAGIFTGWAIGYLADAAGDLAQSNLLDDLEAYRPSEEDLAEWDRISRGDRHG
jgi:hypothetical protein